MVMPLIVSILAANLTANLIVIPPMKQSAQQAYSSSRCVAYRESSSRVAHRKSICRATRWLFDSIELFRGKREPLIL